MKWPWTREREPNRAATQAREAAERHIVEAHEHRDAARAQWPEVHAFTESMREIRKRNHFSAAIEDMWRGRT